MFLAATSQGWDSTIEPAYVETNFKTGSASGDIQHLQEEIDQLRANLTEVCNQCDDISAQLGQTDVKVEEINSSIASLQSQIEELNQAVSSLTSLDCRMDNTTLQFYKE